MADQLETQLLAHLAAEGYQPESKTELAHSLKLRGNMRRDLRGLLARLMKEGVLQRVEQGKFALAEGRTTPESANAARSGGRGRRARGERSKRAAGDNLLVGEFRLGGGGRASFSADPEDPGNRASGLDLEQMSRLRLSGRDLGHALNGDRVEVKVSFRGARRGQSTPFINAKVTRVLERKGGRLVGVFDWDSKKNVGSVTPDDADSNPVVMIKEKPKMDVVDGQLVSVTVTEWEHQDAIPVGRVVQVLGWPGDPGVDIEAIIQKHSLRVDFDDRVLKEAEQLVDDIPEAERQRRADWTKLPVITIDPATAKDHDDAIHVQKLKDGGWELAVHIADVSHFVKPGSALDDEAQLRGNSTYLVDRVLPMLPPDISNDLCSLRPGVKRFTKCALLEFDREGKLRKSRFYDAVILSPVKFSYAEAQEVLDQKDEPGDPVHQMIREAWRLASRLRANRFADGSLDLDFPEISVVLDERGEAVGLKKEVHNESHQLIEEFMLAANEAVAAALTRRGKPAIYRIHEDPDTDKLNDFGEMTRHHGYQPGDLTNKKHLQALLDEIKGSIEAPSLKLALLKSLQRAAYSTEPLGHYGLGKGNYTHFTSPIRRYADLLVHRALQPLLENPPAQVDRLPAFAKIAELAKHISTTERVSSDAENDTKFLKVYEYLAKQPSAAKRDVFDATITEIRPMGLFIELVDLSLRAMVNRDDLPGKGDWFYDGGLDRYSTSKGEFLTLGQALRVEVIKVDAAKREIDCKIVEIGKKSVAHRAAIKAEASKPTKGSKKKKSHTKVAHPQAGKKRRRRRK